MNLIQFIMIKGVWKCSECLLNLHVYFFIALFLFLNYWLESSLLQ